METPAIVHGRVYFQQFGAERVKPFSKTLTCFLTHLLVEYLKYACFPRFASCFQLCFFYSKNFSLFIISNSSVADFGKG